MLASEATSENRLQHIIALSSANPAPLHGMLSAFVACLGLPDACKSLLALLDSEAKVRRTILNRILYLARSGEDAIHVDGLAHQLLSHRSAQRNHRVTTDSILSAVFTYCRLETMHTIVEAWKADNLRSSKARWLKVAADHNAFFDADEIVRYWYASGDHVAAKLIAYKAPSDIVTACLDDIARWCSSEDGWIIGRAALRATKVRRSVMNLIKEDHPATYAYICAKKGLNLSHSNAIDLFFRADPLAISGGRGLVLWSIGQLGMWTTLEELHARTPEILARDAQRFMERYAVLPVPFEVDAAPKYSEASS